MGTQTSNVMMPNCKADNAAANRAPMPLNTARPAAIKAAPVNTAHPTCHGSQAGTSEAVSCKYRKCAWPNTINDKP